MSKTGRNDGGFLAVSPATRLLEGQVSHLSSQSVIGGINLAGTVQRSLSLNVLDIDWGLEAIAPSQIAIGEIDLAMQLRRATQP